MSANEITTKVENNVSTTDVEVAVTTKNPKKPEVVKRLAEWNRKSWLKLHIVNLS